RSSCGRAPLTGPRTRRAPSMRTPSPGSTPNAFPTSLRCGASGGESRRATRTRRACAPSSAASSIGAGSDDLGLAAVGAFDRQPGALPALHAVGDVVRIEAGLIEPLHRPRGAAAGSADHQQFSLGDVVHPRRELTHGDVDGAGSVAGVPLFLLTHVEEHVTRGHG